MAFFRGTGGAGTATFEQLGVRVQTQYKQEHLGTLLTADTLYGTGELRDKSAVALVVPA